MERVVKHCNGEVVESVSRDDLEMCSQGTKGQVLVMGLGTSSWWLHFVILKVFSSLNGSVKRFNTILHLHAPIPLLIAQLTWELQASAAFEMLIWNIKAKPSKMNTQKHGPRFHSLHPRKKNQLNILTCRLSSHLYCCSRSFQTLLQQFHYQ